MLVFAASDKGGTGRSVTSSNVVYRRALQGSDVAYLDFDFGSPTVGTIFMIPSVERGTKRGGLHGYLKGSHDDAQRIDIWSSSERDELRGSRPDGSGQLCLFPGDEGGGEFASASEIVARCARLFLRLDEEFDVVLVDLSAGRSYATEIVLAATARPELRAIQARWLVFHRWTQQHILAASGLAYGAHGIIRTGEQFGHDPERLLTSIRFVRTAVVDPDSEELAGLRPEQIVWLRMCNDSLQRLAGEKGVGRSVALGTIPLDPLLQWREQLISDSDTITRQTANQATVDAFETVAKALTDDDAWLYL